MYDHTLNPLKGWPSPTALDFTGKLHEDVTIDPLPAGRCVHVAEIDPVPYGPGTSGGVPQFKTGVEDTQMGIFLFQGSDALDVANPGGTDWYAIAPKGIMSGLVATGAYELETTEYDSELTYLPNDVLRAVANDVDDTPETGGGCLTNDATVYTDAIVGVVSRGEYTNAYGKSCLAFWPVYLPADPCHAENEPCGAQGE
jgi:hypothetical protein